MELIRDLLDKQVVDREKTKIGKVDGIVMLVRPGGQPRIGFIELGAISLARRLGRPIERLALRVWGRLGGEKAREPHRIPWSKVRDIGVDVDVDIDVRDTRIFAWQDWLRNKIIRHIPGA
jgi:sporulation protein YlmC with PRC-barrel domain